MGLNMKYFMPAKTRYPYLECHVKKVFMNFTTFYVSDKVFTLDKHFEQKRGEPVSEFSDRGYAIAWGTSHCGCRKN